MRNAKPIAVARVDSPCDGVVLLHGIGVGPWTLKRLERTLQRHGYATLNLGYASRKKPLEALAEEIHAPIAAFAKQCDGVIHFAAHSMGGLLTRVYLSKHRPDRLGRVVMLGTPNGGSEVADLLKGVSLYRAAFGPAGLQLTTTQAPVIAALPSPDYAVGIIAGCRTIAPIASAFVLPRPNDGRVSLASAQLVGMADCTIVKASHTGLPRHAIAIEQTIAFLHDGRFSPTA